MLKQKIFIFIISFTLSFTIMAMEHKPITQELIKLLVDKPEVKIMLKQSIESAKQKNPNKQTNPVQNLADYYEFIDKYVTLIPQDKLNTPKELTRDRILQSICYFYFIVDQPLSQLKSKGLYYNSLQYHPAFSKWLVKFADAWGLFLDTKDSWSEKTFKEFYKDAKYGLQTSWYAKGNPWQTFNDFFSRKLMPGARPISAANDPAIVTFPADSVPQGVWRINEKSKIQVEGGIQVKLARYYNVSDLLSANSSYKDSFKKGYLTHTFLNVFDYHRYHLPVSGVVKEVRRMTKNVTLAVSYDKKRNRYVPIDSTGWQFAQTRGYVIIDTKEYGLVALIPMGMAQVSSVNFDKYVKIGTKLNKGQELGYFLFGGSDFIMLFQEKSSFKLMAPKSKDAGYLHQHVGQVYGRFNN